MHAFIYVIWGLFILQCVIFLALLSNRTYLMEILVVEHVILLLVFNVMVIDAFVQLMEEDAEFARETTLSEEAGVDTLE